jgi:hypothetical protein
MLNMYAFISKELKYKIEVAKIVDVKVLVESNL